MRECNLYQPVAQQGGSWEIKVSISLSSYPLITCQLLPSLKLPRSQSDREPMMWPIKGHSGGTDQDGEGVEENGNGASHIATHRFPCYP